MSKFGLIICFLFSFSASYFFQKLEDTRIIDSNGEIYANPFLGGLNAPQFSIGDLDLDGELEIALYERDSKIWIVFERTGLDLVYSETLSNSLPRFNQDFSLLRDFNNDGKPDIIMNNGINLKVYINDGTIESEFNQSTVLKDLVTGDPIFHRDFDLPGVSDVDGDGDLDLLLYGTNVDYLEYWKNISQELYGHSDSLVYLLSNSCWGHFTEINSIPDTLTFNLFDTCSVNVSNPEKNKHIGSSVTILDYDNNGVVDLLIGDPYFPNLPLLLNGGEVANSNSSLDSIIPYFPENSIPIYLERFPAGYWLDIDKDGKEDLVVAPNTTINSNMSDAILYYKNYGVGAINEIYLQETSFLQKDMIDRGKHSYPTVGDVNGDSFEDILLGNYGFFDDAMSYYTAELTLYQSGVDDSLYYEEIIDYANLSQFNLRALYPAWKDLDDDNDLDILYGDELGNIHLALNNNDGTFSYSNSITDNNGLVIDVGQNAAPCLYDLDGDFDFDLVIGNRNGLLTYYENIGDASNFSFNWVTDSLGMIDDFNTLYGGFTKPWFYKNTNNELELIVSSWQGDIFRYGNIVVGSNFQILDTLDFFVGQNPSVCYADPDQDGEMEYLIGSERGGMSVFTDQDLSTSRVDENEIQIIEKEVVCFSFGNEIFLENLSDQSHQVFIWSIEGRLLTTLQINGNQRLVVNSPLSTGIYVVSSVTGGLKQKIVVD